MKKVIVTIIILVALGCGAAAYAYESNSSNGAAGSNNQIENNIGGQAQSQSTDNNNSSESSSNSTSSNQNNTSQNNSEFTSSNNQGSNSSSNSTNFSNIYNEFYGNGLLMFNKSPNYIPLQHDNIFGTYNLSKVIGTRNNDNHIISTLVMTKDLYAYNGTNICNPDYYEVLVPMGNINTSAEVAKYFGENSQLILIVAVPHDASEETIKGFISSAIANPSNFPYITQDGLAVFNNTSYALLFNK